MKLDKNYKVRVTPEQSRKIQELAFELGFEWYFSGKQILHTEISNLTLGINCMILGCFENNKNFYADTRFTEISADDLIALLADLSKSTENPLQGVELTPEFEVVPKFKVGDKVYYRADEEIFVISDVSDFGDVQIKDWREDYHNSKYFCHATQENYERLQATFTDIEFKQPTKELKGSDLATAMLEKGWKYVPCYVGEDSDVDAIDHCRTDIIVYQDKSGTRYFRNQNNGQGWDYAVPFDPRTGKPLTEAVLDEN